MKDKYRDFTSYSVICRPSAVRKYGSNASLVQVVPLDESTWPGGLR